MPLDGICLALHGAGVAEGCGDIEGDLLRDLRREFGAIPVAATLDLHGNITERMVDNADMLFGVKEYPHIDMYERGQDAITHLHAMIARYARPRAWRWSGCRWRFPTTNTFHGPLKDHQEPLCRVGNHPRHHSLRRLSRLPLRRLRRYLRVRHRHRQQ